MYGKEELWQILLDRNPSFDGECKFGKGQVRKFFELVWDQSEKRTKRVDDVFGGLFGAVRK